MKKKIYEFMAATEGAMALEYTFLAAAIGGVLVAGAFVFAGDFGGMEDIFSFKLTDRIEDI